MRRIRVLAVLAAAATVAACSGSAEPAGEPGSESTQTSAVPSVGHGSLAYCLREHGVSANAIRLVLLGSLGRLEGVVEVAERPEAREKLEKRC